MIEKVEISKEQIISFALDYLRFPLALIVILVHVLNIDDVGVDVSGCNVGMIEHGSIFDSVRYIINVFIRFYRQTYRTSGIVGIFNRSYSTYYI